MKFGRVFLAVAGVLGAEGCHFYVDEPPPPAPVYEQRTAVVPAPSRKPPPPPPPPAQPWPYQPAQPYANRTSRSALRASAPELSTAVGCLDTGTFPVPDCEIIRAPLPSCAPPTSPRKRCAEFQAYFDPKVAASAVSCLASLTRRQLCDSSQADACAQIALAEACLDPSVVQLCQIAQTPCSTTESACSALLSGLNDRGQETVAQCVAQGCSGGLDGCLHSLTSGP
jgi:hypothetical protein